MSPEDAESASAVPSGALLSLGSCGSLPPDAKLLFPNHAAIQLYPSQICLITATHNHLQKFLCYNRVVWRITFDRRRFSLSKADGLRYGLGTAGSGRRYRCGGIIDEFTGTAIGAASHLAPALCARLDRRSATGRCLCPADAGIDC